MGDLDNRFADKKINDTFKTPNEFTPFIDSLIVRLHNELYYGASLDTLFQKDSTHFVGHLYVGKKYKLGDIKSEGIDSSILDTENFTSIKDVQQAQIDLVNYYESQGYPFTKVKLEDVLIDNREISGSLILDLGEQIYIDSIELHSTVVLRNGYLEKYLEMEQEALFNIDKLDEVNRRLQELPFLKLEKPTEISFKGNRATLHVYAQPSNASRFDFIFGIIPTNELEDQSLFISLDIKAEMLNKLGFGEYLYFEFERLRPEQQKLNIKVNYPYLLDLPIAVDGGFSIFRNALDFQTVNANAGIQYLLSHRNYVKLLWNFNGSNLISIDSVGILDSMALPENLDVSRNGFGIELGISSLDYKFNPRKGLRWVSRVIGGQKQIKRNATIESLSNDVVDFVALYDALDPISYSLDFSNNFELYLPLAQRGVFKFQTRMGWRLSGEQQFKNELFQIGGYNLLRGFDEASIFTAFYVVPTLEYRLILSKNSYFNLPFVDFAFIELNEKVEFGYGVGAGLSFETKVGLFNFSVAAGTLGDIELDLGKPKAHFGFISIF